MTDLQIDIAISSWMPACPLCGWKTAITHRCKHSPDYCKDLEAMFKVEAMLNKQEQADYADWLWHVVAPDDLNRPTVPLDFCTLHATARQRAEAFVRTLKLL